MRGVVLTAALIVCAAAPAAAQTESPPASARSPIEDLRALATSYAEALLSIAEGEPGRRGLERAVSRTADDLADGLGQIVPHECYLDAYAALWERVGALRLWTTLLQEQPRAGRAVSADSQVLFSLRLPPDTLTGASCPPEITPPGPTPAPPMPAPTTEALPSPAADPATSASGICAGSSYSRCQDSLLFAMDVFAGSLVAICEYGDGEGDVVLLDSRGEAEARCSGDGLISPSRVFEVVQLP